MFENDPKYVKAVTNLLRKTKAGLLTWQVEESHFNVLAVKMGQSSQTYTASYQGKRFRLSVPAFASLNALTSGGRFGVGSRAQLEIVSQGGDSLFMFPSVSVIDDLYKAVSDKYNEIETFIDNLARE
ncbi:hypothetical protein J7643_12870 [bacterium]|nr:hypothetical protein [bacterium]